MKQMIGVYSLCASLVCGGYFLSNVISTKKYDEVAVEAVVQSIRLGFDSKCENGKVMITRAVNGQNTNPRWITLPNMKCEVVK